MGITATIMNTATGQPIQKMSFGRMPKPWASFNLATGELVTAERIDVGKPEPGKFAAPVHIWVTVKPRDRAVSGKKQQGEPCDTEQATAGREPGQQSWPAI